VVVCHGDSFRRVILAGGQRQTCIAAYDSCYR
jgi:hypothetical protein